MELVDWVVIFEQTLRFGYVTKTLAFSVLEENGTFKNALMVPTGSDNFVVIQKVYRKFQSFTIVPFTNTY